MGKNRLSGETSPYLLQHENNPVHWWAWGDDAFAAAKKEGKPVLLSVGYAACHWCHVMAHESFEDQATADLMNSLFINVKVDREERPDVDTIYQRALNMMGQQGGWPLTIFLDPEGKPFWGGTYFPDEPRHGMASFKSVLQQISKVYHESPEAVGKNREALLLGLERAWKGGDEEDVAPSVFFGAMELINQNVDPDAGGMKGAPKFPNMPLKMPLWAAGIRKKNDNYKLNFSKTMTMICQGGIYDHLGGGLCRYAVDAYWLVPHFEKMLYDNALFIEGLCEAYKETKSPLFEARVSESIGWLQREMKMKGGAYAASLDADSEGEEGKFYIWTQAEVDKILGEDAKSFSEVYGVSPEGNWEGRNILHRLLSAEHFDANQEKALKLLRERLLAVRDGRPRPFLDDKILADWNGLLIHALVVASTTFQKSEWLKLAKGAFDFIVGNLQKEEALYHSYRENKLGPQAMLDDYAAMIRAATALFSATSETAYLDQAEGWMKAAETTLQDKDGSFYMSGKQKPQLIARPKTIHDQATPSGNGLMIENYVRLYHLTGKEAYRDAADTLLKVFGKAARTSPFASGAYFTGFDAARFGGHLFIQGKHADKKTKDLLKAAYGVSFPGLVIQVEDSGSHLPQAKGLKAGQAILCQGTTCSLPVETPAALRKLLETTRVVSED